jgi:molybdate transport system substrate-binding protein
MGKTFEAAHPGITVLFNFAGSQTLRAQIIQGSPTDVIALASLLEMRALSGLQLVDAAESKRIFASNKMVVILPPQNPAKVASLQDLAKPGLKLIIAAEPVPAGKYARVVLENLNKDYGNGFNQKVLANVVSNEENVRQVTGKIELGEGDAGIVYLSDAAAAPDLLTLEIPDAANELAQYPIAALRDSPNKALAEEFISYVLSPDGQAELKKWGFLPPQ